MEEATHARALKHFVWQKLNKEHCHPQDLAAEGPGPGPTQATALCMAWRLHFTRLKHLTDVITFPFKPAALAVPCASEDSSPSSAVRPRA